MDDVKKENGGVQIPEDMTFEAALARLEVIVGALDTGSAPLDESLKMFEEGVALVRLCNDRLDHAEQRMKMLVCREDGTVVEQPFGTDAK